MSRASLERAVPKGERVLLDTSTLISYLGEPDQVTDLAAHVIDEWVRTGRNPAVVSMVTAMEVLVGPLAVSPGEQYLHVRDFLERFPNLKAQPVDLTVAQEAASLRAEHKFRSPDALVIGTGIATQVGHLITNDEQWKKKLANISARVKVCYLKDHAPL